MRVAALTQNLDSSSREIAEAIGCDPVLGARVLRAANSPLYYLERDVTTLTMAVNAIGNDSVGLLVIVKDVNNDGFSDIIVSNKKGVFIGTMWKVIYPKGV